MNVSYSKSAACQLLIWDFRLGDVAELAIIGLATAQALQCKEAFPFVTDTGSSGQTFFDDYYLVWPSLFGT